MPKKRVREVTENSEEQESGLIYKKARKSETVNNTAVVRVQEHQVEGKTLNNVAQVVVNATINTFDFSVPSISNSIPLINQCGTSYVAKTATERSREFQARKKASNLNVTQAASKTVIHVDDCAITSTSNALPRIPKTAAERSRDYRARKEAARASSDAQSSNIHVPRTNDQPSHNILNELLHQNNEFDTSLTDGSDSITAAGNSTNANESIVPYKNYLQHKDAHKDFDKKFSKNLFGYACDICDRLWFKDDLKMPSADHDEILRTIVPEKSRDEIQACFTCRQSLRKSAIPTFATYNGFKYPEQPRHLPPLDLISERLISPRLPFMQIRRLRHVHGQYGIYGQVINVPVSVNTMVNYLPRSVGDDHCITVHIKKKKIHKSSYLIGLVNKRSIKAWLQYLVPRPLYRLYNINIDNNFFSEDDNDNESSREEVSEDIPIEDSLTAQQHTLLWNEEKYLRIAPGEMEVPRSLLFDEHAEELSFPAIYLGDFRNFRENVRVTPFMMATSELRRSDRRGVTPQHLLYMAMKIMRLRVRDSLTVAFKHVGKNTDITRQQIESEGYVNNCIESNLAFLRSIPNSTWYWAERKRDLFAMIRQLGKPTMFLTLSANEIGWDDLMKTLFKLKNNGREISAEEISHMNFIDKSTLINEDAVTCAIHFNKLVNVFMTILQSKKNSPFGQYYVKHYFKRIEFQHRGSPHAHILLWLDNAPEDPLGANKHDAISLIDQLVSISPAEASGNIKLQTHKHTFTCFKKVVANAPQKCRFEAPFMPSQSTTILTPMQKTDPGFSRYLQRYKNIRINLENNEYVDMETFYEENEITSDEDYTNILRAGITRPRVFLKREPCEKWNNPFNPFIFNVLKSNTDIQFITEEYSCAAYVVEYVNKTNRGISNLQRKIIEIMDEHPEFDIIELTRKMSVDLLNTVELTSQEAAWYLLREPMSKSSVVIVYIPTVWPIERQRIKKTRKQLEEMGCDDDSTEIWKENWFDKYEKRPEHLENISLAQFVAKYTSSSEGNYTERKEPRVIRYRNYDMATDYNEYRREMVTLHIPFRDGETEILAEMRFIEKYEEHEQMILESHREFQSNLDIAKTIEICRELCREDGPPDDENEIQDVVNRYPEPNPFEQLYNNENADINSDMRLATLNKLGAIAKRRENLMPNNQFYELMRMANCKQKELLLHVISKLLSPNSSPLQIFLTGPAGCGKTFVIKLLMEVYNRFTTNDGYCNAYITCASTGKAAVAMDGTTVHTALKISLSKLLPLSNEVALQYRTLFKYVKVLIIDEISMIGAEMLTQIDSRLKQITGNFETNFGGMDIILIGDLRQLPPVRATPIFKQVKQRIAGPMLWRDLKFHELDEVMRQANHTFSSILTKIGNGIVLEDTELQMIESRFFTKEEANRLCPNGIRLFLTNNSVNEYNQSILNAEENKIVSVAKDIYSGCHNTEQQVFVRQKLHKMSTIDTGGLPYELTLVLNKYNIITTNIDVSDGLANGAVGKLHHVEWDADGEVTRVWLEFPDSPKTGQKIRKKAAAYIQANNLSRSAVPIGRRTSTITLNNNKTIIAKRNHFPLISACAMTIHKAQGGTFSEIVYEYDKRHSLQLLYVALSRVTSIQGLYIVTANNDTRFYHGRRTATSIVSLQEEFRRLSLNRLKTIESEIVDFITNKRGLSMTIYNCQSLDAHVADLTDKVIQQSNILMLTETWLKNEEHLDIPNFNCIAHIKRPNARAAGVALYHNSNDTVHAVTPHIDITFQQTNHISMQESAIGEICSAECILENEQKIILVVIYISPNHSITQIGKFILRALLAYTVEGAAILGEDLEKIPMILEGDFNTNFASEEAQPLIELLHDKLKLEINNNPTEATTRSGTTIDAIFSRYIGNLHSKIFISHFSFHKPIVSFLEYV